jgi:nucleotide-binding universal stress UspA family protein
MFKRILAVSGGQPWVDASVEYALALAAETGAELSLLSVPLPPVVAGMPDLSMCSGIVLESIVAESETVLASIVAAAEQAEVPCTVHVRWGNTADMILRTAVEDDCDLIIIGSYADTWRSRWLLGHLLTKVTTYARQPLLVVTAPAEESYAGAAWSRLLVVHDGSRRGAAPVHYALALAQAAALDVCVLHVNTGWQPANIDASCLTPEVQSMLSLATTQAAIAGVHHDVILAAGNRVTAIVETAAARACGVIVLGAAQGNGWQRLVQRHTVKAVLANTTLPVLLVNHSATYWG